MRDSIEKDIIVAGDRVAVIILLACSRMQHTGNSELQLPRVISVGFIGGCR